MKAELVAYLKDIEFSISRIEFHRRNISSYTQFKDDWTAYDAIERRIAILGEAIWQIEKIDNSIDIKDKKKIIGLRHILTHDYDLISPDIIWKIIEVDIPILKENIISLLNQKEL